MKEPLHAHGRQSLAPQEERQSEVHCPCQLFSISINTAKEPSQVSDRQSPAPQDERPHEVCGHFLSLSFGIDVQ